MSQINNVWNASELALASYATLLAGDTNRPENRDPLSDAGLTPAQREDFTARYPTIVTQYADTLANGGMGTGFNATVFKDKNDPGNLTLAIRGTDSLAAVGDASDLAAGIDIVGSGAAYDQIVAMVNWWLRATTLKDQMVNQFRLVELSQIPEGAVVLRAGAVEGTSYVLDAAPQVKATGEVQTALAADPDLRVEVTGHSLGGHLAMAFSSLFAASTGQVTVFNAPGFANSTLNKDFFAKFDGSIPTSVSIANVIADEALVGNSPYNFVAGMHSRPGVPINISIEKQTNSDEPSSFGSLNHSIVTLTDSLAVYKLLAELTPVLTSGGNAFTTADYKRVLNQVVQGTAAGYERIVDTLEKLLTGNSELLETGNNQREALYQAIQGLTQLSAYTAKKAQLTIEAVTGVAGDFATNAQPNDARGLAWRYALKELDPFAVVDANNTGVYARFLTGGSSAGELDIYDPSARTGALTTQWLQDRAALLQRRLDIAAKDENNDSSKSSVLSNPNKTWAADNLYFEDRATGYILNQGANGGQRVHDPYIIFGSDRNDGIAGSDKADRLYGSGGADYLIGKGGADYLEGGTGLDIYEYDSARKTGLLGATSTDGHDDILDVDGKGILRYKYGNEQSTVLAGVAIKESEGKWKTPDGRFVLEQMGSNLKVSFGAAIDGSVTIENFDFTKATQDGYFGIRLIEIEALPVTVVPIIIGDYAYQRDENGVVQYDPVLGNPLMNTDPQAAPDTINVLQDSAGNDRIEGFTFSDWLVARRGGDDRILGGEERDYIEGGGENDVIEGGADGNTGYLGGGQFAFDIIGGDVLLGGVGNDRLYGNIYAKAADLIRDGETGISGTIRGDVLDGGDGNDFLAGDVNGDVLLGGSGDDILIGGSSDDFLLGDAERAFQPIDLDNPQAFPYWGWSITSVKSVTTRVDTFHQFSKIEATVPGRDVIYGGAGNDVVTAGGNDDVVWGGSGEDWLFGEGGSDILNGGTQNDVLSGDSASTPLELHGDDYLDGGDGDDYLFGNGGNDILIGGAGSDQLQGGNGADILMGGAGNNDILIGGAGKDTYIFNKGDGLEIIDDTARDAKDPEASIVVFGDGITETNVKFGKGSLLIDLGPSNPDDPLAGNDQIHFINFNSDYPGLTAAIGEIRFADGTSMDYADILAQGFDIDGTAFDDIEGAALIGTSVTDRIRGFAGSDVLEGRDGDDVLTGDGGADRLDGGNGDDVLDGGAGKDLLVGGMGSDDYQFVSGDGLDTLIEGSLFVRGLSDPDHVDRIVFGEGIARENVFLFRTGGGNLTVRYGIGDETLIEGQYSLPGSEIEEIAFFDGETISKAELDALEIGVVDGAAGNDEIYGGSGNDVLRGLDGDDYLDGGPTPERRVAGMPLVTGDDVLDGGTGADTYALHWGMGSDLIIDTNDGLSNTLKLLNGTTFNSVRTTRDGDDLLVNMRGAGGGSARVQNFFADGSAETWLIGSEADSSQSLFDLYTAQSTGTNEFVADAMEDYKQRLLGEWRAQSQASLDLPTRVYVQSTWSQTTAQWTTLMPAFPEPVPQVITILSAPATHTTVQRFGFQQGSHVVELPQFDGAVVQRIVDPYVEEIESNDSFISTQSSSGVTSDFFEYTFFAGGGGPFSNPRTYSYSNGFVTNTVTESSAEGWIPLTLREDGLGPFNLTIQQLTEVPIIEQITAGAGNNTIFGALENDDNHVALIDAGAGNDIVTAGQYDFIFGNDGSDRIRDGAYAYGGNGFDSLSGARFMAGGADDDFLSGGEGETTFYFRSDEAGWDQVQDQSGISLIEFTLRAGFADSLSNFLYGGKYRLGGESSLEFELVLRERFGGLGSDAY